MPTALLSVYDKTGIVDFARVLVDRGWRVISSGGTAKAITAAGLEVEDVADLTGFPPILDHRVVTLHPKIHGGLLADPTNPTHRDDMAAYGISPIELVVCNLYPFDSAPSIDLIDIGGPAMVRAAAKNHAHVGVVVDPADYAAVAEEIAASDALGDDTRLRLAAKAFAHIADYAALIATWFADQATPAGELPATLHLSLTRAQPLRYGENPHQHGARYRAAGASSWWDAAEQLGGKELSYLNLYDTEAAWKLVHRFDEPACVVVKHANPCGVAVARGDEPIADVYRRAHECDPVSAFGGIVALNRTATREMAEALVGVFTEVVVAPDYEPEALEVLAAKKNLRVLRAAAPIGAALDVRSIDGGLLVQHVDGVSSDRSGWRVVSDAQPTDDQWAEMAFAWTVCAAVSSNAIVFTHDRQAVGIGAGQQNRVDSARIAARRAEGRATGGVCASDAFFPFRDTADVAAEAGISVIIQPGGSVRDQESIDAANEHGMVMVFTGQRHFRH